MAEITIREALNQALDEELARDKKVFLMGEEVGHYNGAYKVSQGLLDKYGEDRIVDTPIVEAGFAGLGVGAAMVGLRPIIEFMTWNFSLVAIDQIVNNAAKLRYMSGGQFQLSMVFRGPQGAGGALGAQHSQIFENYYTYIPGLKVVAPSTAKDMKGLLKTAIRDDDVIVFLEGEKMYNIKGDVPKDDYTIPIGEAEIKTEGSDVTIICWSMMYYIALAAAEQLSKENISVELLDLRTLRPLDEKTILKSVEKTNRVVIIQESWPRVSVGTTLSALISNQAFDYLDAPVEIVSAEDVPMPYAFNLEEAALPSTEKLIAAVKKTLR